MAAIHGSKARLLLTGWEVSGSMKDGSNEAMVDVADISTWGMTSKKYIPDTKIDGVFTGSGVHDVGLAGTGSIDEILDTKLAAAQVLTYLPGGDGFGNKARIMGGYDTSYEITSPGDDAVGFSFEVASGDGFTNKGRVLRALTGTLALTTTGNGVSYDDLGAAGTTTKGIAAALQVVSKGGGAGTITVKVQHSPDQSVWTDFITFTGVTVANVAQYLEAAGTVQRYLRAIWTVTGGTWDIHVAAGRR